jgi:hypothetical protein
MIRAVAAPRDGRRRLLPTNMRAIDRTDKPRSCFRLDGDPPFGQREGCDNLRQSALNLSISINYSYILRSICNLVAALPGGRTTSRDGLTALPHGSSRRALRVIVGLSVIPAAVDDGSPFASQVSSPAQASVSSPAQASVSSPAQASVSSPAQASVSSPAQASVSSPAQASVSSPAQASVSSPAQASVSSPAQASVSSPAQAGDPRLAVLRGKFVDRRGHEPLIPGAVDDDSPFASPVSSPAKHALGAGRGGPRLALSCGQNRRSLALGRRQG